mgnify:CR=1 FL=1|jgi:SAM-dependent methyltransferase
MNKNKIINCTICNEKSFFSHKYSSPNIIFKNKDIFTCEHCEFSWAADIKQADLNEYYKKDYDVEVGRSKKFVSPEEYFSDAKKQFKRHRSEMHLLTVKRYLKNKKEPLILDIGSGLGTTLNLSKKYFIDPKIHAYENDENSKKYLNYINAQVISGDCISSLKNLNVAFDIIIASHFLEHVSPDSLKDFINIIYNLLKPGGILLIEVPNDNWQKYPDRKYSNPPHVNFFSIISLKKYFKQFNILRCCSIREPLNKKKNFIISLIFRVYAKILYIINQAINKVDVPCVKNGNGTSLILIAKKLIL